MAQAFETAAGREVFGAKWDNDLKERIEGREAKLAAEILEREMRMLEESGDHEEIFRMIPGVEFDEGMRIAAFLKETGWRSPDERGRAIQERLEALLGREAPAKIRGADPCALAFYTDFRPMLLGEEAAPGDDAGLLRWLEDKQSFRRRSAAVVLLAERGSEKLAGAADKASADDYWPVRMAAAVAEALRPKTLSSASRSRLENDHVCWVQAVLSAPRDLAETDSAQKDAMRRSAASGPSGKPDRPDDFYSRIYGVLPTVLQEYMAIVADFPDPSRKGA